MKQVCKCLLAVILVCTVSAHADGPRIFSLPNSALLFGTYDQGWVVTPIRSDAITLPVRLAANQGYFAYPGISPRGDLVAWGFAVGRQQDRAKSRLRFTLGLYSLSEHNWKTYGDFDNRVTPVFSPDGSKIAFVAEQQGKSHLLILDVSNGTMTNAPYTNGMSEGATLSWSPDAKLLAVDLYRGEKSPLIGVLELATGNMQSLGEGTMPSWSPTGEWIAYFDASDAKCIVVHPDASGTKVVRTLRQSWFSYRRFGWGRPVWSPDGTQMLLNEMKDDGDYIDVMLLDVASGRTARKARNGTPVLGWASQHK